MDTRKGFLNVFISVFCQALMLVFSLITRRFVIKYLGNDVNGLTSLYSSIIGVLSVTELGVGSAITFCMYEPIVKKDDATVSALYNLFKKLYTIIGLIIFVGGLIVIPFLRYLAKDYNQLDVNFALTFFLTLVSTVLSYTYSAKASLINAHKNNFITTSVASFLTIFRHLLEMIVIWVTRSFVLYLLCSIVVDLIHFAILEAFVSRKYPNLIHTKNKVDKKTANEVTKNIKAMFMHTIGNVLVNTIDSLIISAFIGVVILGKYSNYTVIIASMITVLKLFFTPLSSVIGHVYYEESKEEVHTYFKFFHTFNFVLGTIFFLGYNAIIDQLISLLFGSNLLMGKQISFIITLNYFIQFMRQAPSLFRNATGTFYYDRWKPIAEGISNAVLSILFVKIFPEELSIVGVLVATIITNLFICDIVEPYVVYKHAFEMNPAKYYVKNYFYIALFAGLLLLENSINIHPSSIFLDILVNGCIAVAIGAVVFGIVFLSDKTFRIYSEKVIKKVVKHP